MNKIECVKGWESQLVPGQLYVIFETVEGSNGETHERDGSFVYWTGRELAYEDGDVCHADWDYLVQQSTKPNPGFIETGWWN